MHSGTEEGMANKEETPTGSDMAAGSRRRMITNRVLTAIALLVLVLGVLLGQAFITWLNATLL